MIVTQEVEYQHEDTICRGFLAYDSTSSIPKPGVLVAHDWEGRGERACDKAKQLASIGYVGFALDMFGRAQLGRDKEERSALIAPLMNDRKKLVHRIEAAYRCFSQVPQVARGKIAALGYCFGGLCVLDLARAGVDVLGVISFHGILSAPMEDTDSPISSKILILHGYEDPLANPQQVEQCAEEMTKRKADWQIHLYGHTAHAFTNPNAHDPELGLFYNEHAEKRSWQLAELFLNEVLYSTL